MKTRHKSATQPALNSQPYPRATHIEMWPIERLVPFARNPRTHSDAQVTQIAASIAAFGFDNPILVATKAGILAGHGRYLAALELGLETVSVIILDQLSEIEKRAFLRHNGPGTFLRRPEESELTHGNQN
jgi:hypothetical protein